MVLSVCAESSHPEARCRPGNSGAGCVPECLLVSCYGGLRKQRGSQGVFRHGRGGAGPGAAGHPGELAAGGCDVQKRLGPGGREWDGGLLDAVEGFWMRWPLQP